MSMNPKNVLTGRIIRNSDVSFPRDVSILLSMEQALRNEHQAVQLAERRSENPDSLQHRADFLSTSSIDVELPVKLSSGGMGSLAPITVVELFAEAVSRSATLPALCYKIYTESESQPGTFVALDRKFRVITWEQYWSLVCKFAKALLALNFRSKDRVVMMGTNSPQWVIAHMGTIFAGGVTAGIYATNGIEATEYIVRHSSAVVAVVDSRENLDKMLKVKRNCPSLKAIVIYRDDPPDGYESHSVIPWDDFLTCGLNVADLQLTQRIESLKPGHVCSLVYTSGTTGKPKAVMLSHDNYCWTAMCVQQLDILNCDDRVVSYLPLSHIASQIMDMYLPMTVGCAVYYAAPDALQGSLLTTLKEVRPTWFFGVPRVWEKFEEKLKEVGAEKSALLRRVADWAKRIGYAGTKSSLTVGGPSAPFGHSFVKTVILSKIHKALGLDQCRAFGTGAAPLLPSTQEYFISLGMPICDLFGLSETTGPQTFTLPTAGWFKHASIGRAMPGTEVTIHQPNSEGIGELCFRGRNVFMGYFNNPEATCQAIDENGFLHTGDIGYIDDNGFLYVTGRLKELLITAGGENVAPVLIEALVTEEMKFISNCQVVGDRKKFLSLLICLRSNPDSNGRPTNNLAESTARFFQGKGATCRTTFEAATDSTVNDIIQEGILKVNKKCPSRAQHIRKWRIVPQDFTQEGGELTPSLKLKRNVVAQKYQDLIDSMYEEGPQALHTKSRL